MLLKDVLASKNPNILFGYLGENYYTELLPLQEVPDDLDDETSKLFYDSEYLEKENIRPLEGNSYLLLDVEQKRDEDKASRIVFSEVNYINNLMNAPAILYGLDVELSDNIWGHEYLEAYIDVRDYSGRACMVFKILGKCDPEKRKQIAYQDFEKVFENARIKANNLERALNDQTRILNNLNLFFSKYATT